MIFPHIIYILLITSSSSLISTIGSFLNTVQTGFLFKQFIKKDISIPMIASLCGIVGMVAMLLCVSGNKSLFMIGAVSLIIAYGFSSPAAPAILSVSELAGGGKTAICG